MNLFFHYPKVYNSSFHPILTERHSRIQNRRNNQSIWRNNEKSETATSCAPVTVATTSRIHDCPVGIQLRDEQNILQFQLYYLYIHARTLRVNISQTCTYVHTTLHETFWFVSRFPQVSTTVSLTRHLHFLQASVSFDFKNNL